MIQKALGNLKIASLNEMQLASLEANKKGNDMVILAPTGSGKTLAFLLPVLEIINAESKGVQVLIMVPSRELGLQIEQVFKLMSTGFKVNCCYGGHSTKIEKNNLEQPPAVLIGTPGRIAYHVRENNFDVTTVQTLVLDEFDKALELGFTKEMTYIIGELSNVKKRILTSATQVGEIPSFTGVKNAVELNFLRDKPSTPDLKLKAVASQGKDKLDMLFHLICNIGNKSTLVFCNHREAVDRISDLLKEKGLVHDVFHGGMEQEDRERALLKFRNGSHRLLITTDLASRGLDIPEIEYVIHYQLPLTADAFIHRNGRTARMHAKGTSYLVLASDEQIPDFIKEKPTFEKLPAEFVLPEKTEWQTLYIAAGKKDKMSKADIVGLLLQKGKLQKDELGLIEVLDNTSYAAVKRNKIKDMLDLIKTEKIKGKKVKIEVSR